MSQILISGLKVNTFIGVYENEQAHSQQISIDIVIEYNDYEASMSDKIDDAVDYYTITERIKEYLSNSRHRLIESLNRALIGIVASDPRVSFCKISTTKFGVLEGADSVTLTTEFRSDE